MEHPLQLYALYTFWQQYGSQVSALAKTQLTSKVRQYNNILFFGSHHYDSSHIFCTSISHCTTIYKCTIHILFYFDHMKILSKLYGIILLYHSQENKASIYHTKKWRLQFLKQRWSHRTMENSSLSLNGVMCLLNSSSILIVTRRILNYICVQDFTILYQQNF